MKINNISNHPPNFSPASRQRRRLSPLPRGGTSASAAIPPRSERRCYFCTWFLQSILQEINRKNMPPKIWFAFIREKKIIQVIISYSSLIQTIFSLKLTNTPLKKNGGKGRHSGFFLGKRSILIRGKLVVRFKFREDITHTQEKHIKKS